MEYLNMESQSQESTQILKKCIQHPNQDLIYLNTNIQGKIMLACQLCIIKEKLETKKLMPLKTIYSTENTNQFIWSIKENKEIFSIYESIKNANYKELKETINKNCKDLRARVLLQIDGLEEQLLVQIDLQQNFFKNVQQFNHNFYEQVKQMMKLYKTNETELENQLRGLLIDFDSMKENIFSQIKVINNIVQKPTITDILQKFEENMKYFSEKLVTSNEETKAKQQKLILYLNKNFKTQNQELQKINLEFTLNQARGEHFTNKQLQSTCTGCNKELFDITQEQQYFSLPSIQSQDIKIQLFLYSSDQGYRQISLKANLFFFSLEIIKKIACSQISGQISHEKLVVELNGDILLHNNILGISKAQSINVYQIDDHIKNEVDGRLFKINICSVKQLPQEQTISNEYFKLTANQSLTQKYIKLEKNATNNELITKIYQTLRNQFCNSDLYISNSYRQYKQYDLKNALSQNEIEFFKNYFQFINSEGEKISNNSYAVKQSKQFVFIFKEGSISQSEISQISEVDLKLDKIKNSEVSTILGCNLNMISRSEFNIKDQIRVHCSNCEKVQVQQLTQTYKCNDSHYIMIDCSNLWSYVKYYDLNINNWQTKYGNIENSFRLINCLAKTQQSKEQFISISYDSNLNKWINKDNLVALSEQQMLEAFPQILVYSKQEEVKEEQKEQEGEKNIENEEDKEKDQVSNEEQEQENKNNF